MPFKDYSNTPASNTEIGGDLFIGPNMARNDVRPALQQLAADGRDLYDEVIARSGTSTPSFVAAGTGARTRLLQDRGREVIHVTDYVIGDGVADDTAKYRQAITAAVGKELYYPAGITIRLTEQVLWLGETTHRFGKGAKITGAVNNYLIRPLGYPTLLAATVSGAIARDAGVFTMSSAAGLAVGDDFYLYDVTTQEYDINVVRLIDGNTVYTKFPINYNFATAADIRVYKLANACRNVKVYGGRFENTFAGLGGHALGFLNATDCEVDGATFADTGGVGLGLEISLRMILRDVRTDNTGAVGVGCRNLKDFTFSNLQCRFPNADESLTFYKNCAFGVIETPNIEQYLFGQAPAGNDGTAGNNILLDERCCDITIINPRCRGSATYSIFINNGSCRNRVINADIQYADLGGIRIALNSHDNEVMGGWVRNVIQAVDTEIAGNPATAAVQDDATCTGNIFATKNFSGNNGATVAVRQLGTAGRHVMRGLPTYADNTAALAGSLTAGMLYRTAAGAVQVVY